MIIPSIDLMSGQAVQLRQGKEKVLERDNPLELAEEFDRYGQIAVIDLDAAMGKGDNKELIREICSRAECRVGGGIRSVEDAKELVSYGAVKVIIGTKAFENDAVNTAFLEELKERVGRDRLMIAVDALQGEIVTKAWTHKTGMKLFDVLPQIEPYASDLLFTCVEKEGGLQGTDMATIRRLKKKTSCNVTVAGGISTMDDVSTLAAIGLDGQLGMALYTGKIKLIDAFIESLNWKEELIPTITCDASNQVLMLAYSNEESIRNTFESNSMWYYSRSRDELWHKGETSGHTQEFVRMRADCDQDALLATVRQTGAACHKGSYSCFGGRKFSLDQLYEVIRDRFANPVAGSYTATLTHDKVREKVMEEAQEVVEAQTRDEIIWEAADVLYFLTVLLAKKDIGIDTVLNELRRRRQK